MKRLGLWIAAGVALSFTTYWWARRIPQLSDQSRLTLSTEATRTVAPGTHAAVLEITESSGPDATAAPESEATIGERVDELSQSRRAVDRFRAYKLVDRCLIARRLEEMRTDSPIAESSELNDRLAQYVGACDGVTQAQVYRRMENLQIAVDAGLRDAAHEYFVAGPFGDSSAIDQRPDDPLVTEWKQKSLLLLEQAAAAGDYMAINDLAQIYEGGQLAARNAESLLMYLVAESEISTQRGHPIHGLDLAPLETALTPDQTASAVAAGKRLAELR